MAFNGTGTFVRIHNWVTDKINAVPITASRMDAEMDGMATGLSNCITKDGQTTVTANIPMSSKKFTGLTSGNALTDSINLGQVQAAQFVYFGATGGDADNYTLTPSPTLTSSTIGFFVFQASATCNAGADMNISARGARGLLKGDGAGSTTAIEAGDIISGSRYYGYDNGTNIIVFNPEKPFGNLLNTTKASTTQQGISYLDSRITLTNGTDADHDIDFSAGTVKLSDGSIKAVATAETKQLDSTWVAGSGAGGLASGLTIANSTKYSCYALFNSSNVFVGFGFDTSATAANLLADANVVSAGGTQYAYVGTVITNGSANIRPFRQTGQQFYYMNKGTIAEAGDYLITGNYGTAKIDVTLLVPSRSGIIANVMVEAGQTSNSQDRAYLVRSSLEADAAPVQGGALPATTDKFNLVMWAGDSRTNALFQIPTNDATIWYRAEQGNDVNSSFVILVQGWIDTNI